MAERRTYRVRPAEQPGWWAVERGDEEPVSSHPTRELAEAVARNIARSRRGVLELAGPDGKLRRESYP